MNEQDNGPTPGILGADTEQETTPKTTETVFDSKEFVGEAKPEKQKKEFKLPPALMKWQIWAAVCVVIIIISTVVTISSLISKRAAAFAKYDDTIAKINKQKPQFDEDFEKLMREYFDIAEGEDMSFRLYPNEQQQDTAKESCLMRFDATQDDLAIVNKYPKSQDLASAGKDAKQSTVQASRVAEAYFSAAASLESCREDLTTIVMEYFDVEIGKFQSKEHDVAGSSLLRYSQPIRISYKGNEPISFVKMHYELFDGAGVKMTYEPNISFTGVVQGDLLESDIYEPAPGYYYQPEAGTETAKRRYTPKLTGITVRYTYAKE